MNLGNGTALAVEFFLPAPESNELFCMCVQGSFCLQATCRTFVDSVVVCEHLLKRLLELALLFRQCAEPVRVGGTLFCHVS